MLMSIPGNAIHDLHISGLPCENWKDVYIATVTRQEIPKRISCTPVPAARETGPEATATLNAFAISYRHILKATMVERMLATRQENNVLIIYMGRVAAPALKYQPVSVISYTMKDAVLIVSRLVSAGASLH